MKKPILVLAVVLAASFLAFYAGTAEKSDTSVKPEWAINATDIEACSCPMFCQCYFNPEPAAHHGHGGAGKHFCRFNMAFKVNSGHYGTADLTGAKFWVSGDLGENFGDGTTEWAIVTFDKSVGQPQRDGIATILSHMFPVKWGSLNVAEGNIDVWEVQKHSAHAKLNGGKTAEIKLKHFPGMKDEPVVIKNLVYFGLPRNDGFIMMPNEVQAYREGPNAFEFKGTTGFLITVDMNSNDVKKAAM